MFERNKIYNVDTYKAIKEIPDKSIDLIYTDIPYLYEKGGVGKSELSKRIKNNMQALKENNIYNGIDYLGFEINKDFYNIALDRLNGISQKDKKEMENRITLF